MGLDPAALVATLVRWGTFAALLIITGTVAFDGWVIRHAASGRGSSFDEDRLAVRASRLARRAALWLVPLGVVRLLAKVNELRDPGGSWIAPGKILLLGTMWGWALIAQVAIALVAARMFRRYVSRRGGWLMVLLVAILLDATPAFSGHAASDAAHPALLAVLDILHVVAAGTWIGSLFVLTVAGMSRRRETDTAAYTDRIAHLVSAFSPLALASAAMLMVSGAVASWLHLGSLPALWRSRWGTTLLVKLALLAVVFSLGAYNWRRATPRLGTGTGDGARRLARSARAELVIGALVLLATAALVATPLPGEE